MPPMLRIFLGLLAAYVLVSLFYAHLEDDAHAALRKDRLTKTALKQQLAQEKRQLDSVAQRRHNDLVGALRTVRPDPAGTKSSQPPPTTTSPAAKSAPAPTTPPTARAAAGATAGATAQTNPSAQTAPARLQARLAWLLPALLLLGLALLAGFSWIGWRERQNKLLVPDRFERDTPLLELLLRALAGPIGQALPIPRQVKRFASKARLQHNLLHALAKNTQQAPASARPADDLANLEEPVEVRFGSDEQVLAILLLLLLEEEIVRESRAKLEHLTKDSASPVYLRETSQQEFAAELRTLFSHWHETGADALVYERFRRAAADEAVPTYAQLPAVLESEAGEWLLMQLYRLNAGLLV